MRAKFASVILRIPTPKCNDANEVFDKLDDRSETALARAVYVRSSRTPDLVLKTVVTTLGDQFSNPSRKVPAHEHDDLALATFTIPIMSDSAVNVHVLDAAKSGFASDLLAASRSLAPQTKSGLLVMMSRTVKVTSETIQGRN